LLAQVEPPPPPPPPPPVLVTTPLGALRQWHAPESAAADPRFALWAVYHETTGSYLDHCAYLTDLHQRFGQAVRIGVALPSAAAKALAETKPGFVVAALQGDEVQPMLLWSDGEQPALAIAIDSVVDFLIAAAAGKPDQLPDTEACQLLEYALANVADAEVPLDMAQRLVATFPHSGRAHGIAVLEAWWGRGDHAGALAAIDAGVRALANESLPLLAFADLVLRGDRTDPSIARRFALELAPSVAAAGDGPAAQLVYLRALLRAGNDRLAGRLAAKLGPRLAGDPAGQIFFAECLMEASAPAAFRDLASKAIDAAAAAGDSPWIAMARHKVLVRCDELEAANRLAAARRGDEASGMGLNNEAWYTMVRPDTMGRFDTWALAQCEEMQRLEGDRMSSGNKDTVALAFFLGGRLQTAVELQTEAAKGAEGDPRYLGRLERFRSALARQTAVPKPADK
jgi:hypothetical protein